MARRPMPDMLYAWETRKGQRLWNRSRAKAGAGCLMYATGNGITALEQALRAYMDASSVDDFDRAQALGRAALAEVDEIEQGERA